MKPHNIYFLFALGICNLWLTTVVTSRGLALSFAVLWLLFAAYTMRRQT